MGVISNANIWGNAGEELGQEIQDSRHLTPGHAHPIKREAFYIYIHPSSHLIGEIGGQRGKKSTKI